MFSAPNYCGDHGNLAAVLITYGDTYKIEKFAEYEHKPYVLPSYPLMNAFEFFHNDLMGNLLDFLSQMCSVEKEDDPHAYSNVNRAQTIDPDYIDKLIQKSLLAKKQSFSEEAKEEKIEEKEQLNITKKKSLG